MFPRRFKRITALMASLSVVAQGCYGPASNAGRQIAVQTATDSTTVHMDVATASIQRLMNLQLPQSPGLDDSDPIASSDASVLVAAPELPVDSYRQFVLLFHEKTHKQYGDYRNELAAAIEASESAAPTLPDFRPLEEKLNQLSQDHAQFNNQQQEALKSAQSLLAEYKLKLTDVAMQVAALGKISQAIKEALMELDKAVEELRVKDLRGQAAREHLERLFADTGVVGQAIKLVAVERENLIVVGQAASDTMAAAKSLHDKLFAALEELKRLIHDPILHRLIEDTEHEDAHFWKAAATALAFVLNPLLGFLMLILGLLGGPGGGQGQDKTKDGNNGGNANQENPEGSEGTAPVKLPDQAEMLPLKVPQEGEHEVLLFKDESGIWVRLFVKKNQNHSIDLNFTLDRLGTEFETLRQQLASNTLELESVHVQGPYPITAKFKQTDGFQSVQWLSEGASPILLGHSGLKLPDTMRSLPIHTNSEGEYLVGMVEEDGQRFFGIARRDRPAEMIKVGFDPTAIGIGAPGDEHQDRIVSVSLGPWSSPWPIELSILHTVEGYTEEVDLRWLSPDAPTISRGTKPN